MRACVCERGCAAVAEQPVLMAYAHKRILLLCVLRRCWRVQKDGKENEPKKQRTYTGSMRQPVRVCLPWLCPCPLQAGCFAAARPSDKPRRNGQGALLRRGTNHALPWRARTMSVTDLAQSSLCSLP